MFKYVKQDIATALGYLVFIFFSLITLPPYFLIVMIIATDHLPMQIGGVVAMSSYVIGIFAGIPAGIILCIIVILLVSRYIKKIISQTS